LRYAAFAACGCCAEAAVNQRRISVSVAAAAAAAPLVAIAARTW